MSLKALTFLYLLYFSADKVLLEMSTVLTRSFIATLTQHRMNHPFSDYTEFPVTGASWHIPFTHALTPMQCNLVVITLVYWTLIFTMRKHSSVQTCMCKQDVTVSLLKSWWGWAHTHMKIFFIQCFCTQTQF